MKQLTRLVLLLCCFTLLMATAVSADNDGTKNKGGATFTITDLGSLGGTQSLAYAINDHGEIVGQSRLSGDTATHAFFYKRGEMVDLAPLNSGNVETVGPTSISDEGLVASGVQVEGIYYPALLDSETRQITVLGSLGGVLLGEFNGVAMSVNNAGEAVGYSYIDNITRHAFLYSDGVLKDIGPFDGGYSFATAINDSGTVVGV